MNKYCFRAKTCIRQTAVTNLHVYVDEAFPAFLRNRGDSAFISGEQGTKANFFREAILALTNHGRHGLFSFLSSLPFSVLRNLELEANKLYDRANKLYKAALLTRCYVQHFLSPYIDSEVNHKRHFIKIPFINKGIEFIDLHSIFKDNSVISSILNYFNNSETPIICYKYNKPIRSTIFNFN